MYWQKSTHILDRVITRNRLDKIWRPKKETMYVKKMSLQFLGIYFHRISARCYAEKMSLQLLEIHTMTIENTSLVEDNEDQTKLA